MCYYQLSYLKFNHRTGALDHIAKQVGIHKNKYAIIIDAGSTGSRILAFSFHESVIDGSIKLEDGIFVQIKPGLSSFADNPAVGAKKIEELLEKAKDFIPEMEWSNSPLALRATAGLRLLPAEKASALLDEVHLVFKNSPFYTNENSVAIMDGTDEGLYAWFTVNFLLDRIFDSPENTVAALDLGGGSTQITFVPSNIEKIKNEVPSYLEQISVLHHNISIYTHSYLGLGLMAARKEILTVDNDGNETVINSECINPIITNHEWEYGGVKYSISGSVNPLMIKTKIEGGFYEVPIVRMKECNTIIQRFIKSKIVHVPIELKDREVTVFSYFYDRAVESGIIDLVDVGSTTVRAFQKAAKEVCHSPNADQPFMCLDLTFISILFIEGYGLTPETKLTLVKKIDGQEVSWSLGAAFNILQSGL
ncbi:ectonucleoside triphosphate diphosphohydrolase 5-like isoform X2 [Lycorma delicatula]